MDTHAAPTVGRTLHLLDIENLLAGHLYPGDVTALWTQYVHHVPIGEHDHMVAAFGPTGAARAAFELPSQVATRVGAPGPSSADQVLLDLIRDPSWVADRYQNVTIASADHIFAAPAAHLAARGIHLTQVLGARARSYHLGLACHHTIHLTRTARPQAA